MLDPAERVDGAQRRFRLQHDKTTLAEPCAKQPTSSPRVVAVGLGVVVALLVAACANDGPRGTAWGDGSFDSNGERIYFTATSDSGDDIYYDGGPGTGGMMMGGRLSCASCHGTDARGGRHRMHMDVMDAPNIRWVALAAEGDHDDDHGDEADEHDEGYDIDAFRAAVIDGVHPDGEPLDDDMPRWKLTEDDLQDLVDYLQTFDTP